METERGGVSGEFNRELRARGVCEGKHFTVVYRPRELIVENPRARTLKMAKYESWHQ